MASPLYALLNLEIVHDFGLNTSNRSRRLNGLKGYDAGCKEFNVTNRRPEIKLTDDERNELLEIRKEAVVKEDREMELRAAIVLTAERRHAAGLEDIARCCGYECKKQLVSSILKRFVRAPAGKRIDVVSGRTRGRPAGVLKGGNERVEILAEIRQFHENTPGAKVEHYKEFLDEHFDESFAIKTVYRYIEQAGIDLR